MSEILVLLKPDAVRRGLTHEILTRIKNNGFSIQEIYAGTATRTIVQQHYAHLAKLGAHILEYSIDFLTSGPLLMVVASGNIQELRALVGATEPCKAAPGTIRGDLSKDSIAIADGEKRGLHNLIHASDSEQAAAKELKLWREQFECVSMKNDPQFAEYFDLEGLTA